MSRERVVRGDVHFYLRKHPWRLPLRLMDAQSHQEAPVQSGVRLIRVQMSVLVEEDLGEGELQPLVLTALRDECRQVYPAYPDVPVVLDREGPYPLGVSPALPEPLEKWMR